MKTLMTSALRIPVLKLNRNWAALSVISAQKAFNDLAAGAVVALDMAEGESFIPTAWEDWLKLPVREQDDSIGTPNFRVRIPRVVITVNYRELKIPKIKFTTGNLRKHHKDIDGYTGKKLKPVDVSVEHVVPVSKGGKTEWKNCILTHKDINSRRGNKPLEEAGLKLVYPPSEPKPRLPCDTIEHQFPEWKHFLRTRKN